MLLVRCLDNIKHILPNGGEFQDDFHPMVSNPLKKSPTKPSKWDIPWGYNPMILTFDPNFRPGTSKSRGVCGEKVSCLPPQTNSSGPNFGSQ